MPDTKPLGVDEVLRGEQETLRSRGGEPASRAALCISGGGIRSATFGLGAIQSLAQHGLLAQFDYLSTVSGGGYIGSWLTAWANRVRGIENVVPRLRRDAPPPGPGEPDPVQHLRDYNSYLTPRLGALSTDVWTLLATVLRNILLNWMVLIPLLMAVLMVPRLYATALSFPELYFGRVIFATDPPNYGDRALDVIATSPFVHYGLPFLSMALFGVALLNTLRYLPGVGGRDHSSFDYVVKVLAPLVLAVLTFLMVDSLYYLGKDYADHTNLREVLWWMVAPCAGAWLLYLPFHRGGIRERLRLFFGPLSLAIAAMAAGTGAATWAATNYVLWSPDPHKSPSWAEYVTLGPPTMLLGFCLGTVLFAGLSSRFLADEDREWMSRGVAGGLLFAAAWTAVCTLVLVLPQWALGWRTWAHTVVAAGGAVSAWLSTSGGSAAANANPGAARPQGRARVLSALGEVAPLVFLALLAGGLSIFTNILLQGAHGLAGLPLAGPEGQAVSWRDHYGMLTRSDPRVIAALMAAFIVLSWIMARYVNINTFSLHGMYRDRLVRAYLGASNPDRKASRFTDFASTDDLPMTSLQTRPFHVVNLTLNLVAGSRLAWQQRKAASFTVSPLHSGSADVGYRPSSEYGGGITLGTAVALSGAAASPNMGYHSSPVAAFIMTLFNARLGSWLGNPGPPGERTWKQPGPLSAIRSLVKEALGQTSDQSEYVYLSDGGHFENLGLYEMARRRCGLIVVLDSGCDPEFSYEDLGNALRKIRIDLRIPIDFDEESIRKLRAKERRWALATIRYSAVDAGCEDGRLVYIKPMRLGDEPPDVLSYAASHEAFPHQSTNDQWFDESQTESYRQLGLFTVAGMCEGWAGGSLADWYRRLEKGGS